VNTNRQRRHPEHKDPATILRVWIILCVLLAIGLPAGVIWYYQQDTRKTREEVYSELDAIAMLKIKQIEKWSQERIGDSVLLSHDTYLIRTVEEVIEHPDLPGPRQYIIGRLNSMEVQYAYWNVILTGTDGKVIASAAGKMKKLVPVAQENISRALSSGSASFSDFFQRPGDDRIYLDLVAPMKNAEGKAIAAVILRIDTREYLYPLIQWWPSSSSSAETLIVRREGDSVIFLNELRHLPHSALKLTVPLSSESLPAVRAIQGYTGSYTGYDYRDVKVLADIRPVHGFPWFMVAKVDYDEAMKIVRFRTAVVALITLMALMLAVVMTGYVYRYRQRNLYVELYNTESALRQSEELATAIFEQSPISKWISDSSGTFLRQNSSCRSLLQVSDEDVVGKYNLFTDEGLMAEGLTHQIEKVFKEGSIVRRTVTLDIRSFRRTGKGPPVFRTLDTTIAPIRDESGLIKYAVVHQIDVTEQKEAERELQRTSELLRGIIESSPLAIYTFDRDGLVMSWNKAAERMFGWSESEVLGRLHPIVTAETADEFNELKSLVISGGKITDREICRVRQDGTPIHMSISAAPLHDEKGDTIGVMSVTIDISERKKAAEEIRKLNAELEERVRERTRQLEETNRELEISNRELESFSYTVSHDLRAPLRAIEGFTRILMDDFGPHLGEEGSRLCTVIRTNTMRMSQLIDDLLAFSRLGRASMHRHSIDMTAMAEAAFYEVVPETGRGAVELHIEKMPFAKADRALLSQMWVNLISNAVKFSSKRERPVIEIGSRMDGDEPVYFVKDNGAGFDMKYRDKLFGVFQRLHSQKSFEGTGVGLAIVHRIITRHGGRVWAEGEVDRGAAVYFTIPDEEVAHG
jgi:PAS domain S-box-containing protein